MLILIMLDVNENFNESREMLPSILKKDKEDLSSLKEVIKSMIIPFSKDAKTRFVQHQN